MSTPPKHHGVKCKILCGTHPIHILASDGNASRQHAVQLCITRAVGQDAQAGVLQIFHSDRAVSGKRVQVWPTISLVKCRELPT